MTTSKVKDTSIIDKNIGKKIYELRLSKGQTRKELGAEIGVTHQQLQKYENGVNRITASRLYDVAKALEVSVSSFYRDAEDLSGADFLPRQRICVDVMKDFQAIERKDQQLAIKNLIRSMVATTK